MRIQPAPVYSRALTWRRHCQQPAPNRSQQTMSSASGVYVKREQDAHASPDSVITSGNPDATDLRKERDDLENELNKLKERQKRFLGSTKFDDVSDITLAKAQKICKLAEQVGGLPELERRIHSMRQCRQQLYNCVLALTGLSPNGICVATFTDDGIGTTCALVRVSDKPDQDEISGHCGEVFASTLARHPTHGEKFWYHFRPCNGDLRPVTQRQIGRTLETVIFTPENLKKLLKVAVAAKLFKEGTTVMDYFQQLWASYKVEIHTQWRETDAQVQLAYNKIVENLKQDATASVSNQAVDASLGRRSSGPGSSTSASPAIPSAEALRPRRPPAPRRPRPRPPRRPPPRRRLST